MSDETTVLPDEGNGEDVNVNVPDTTGGQQVPDTIPEPVPVPEPENKDIEDKGGRPGPVPGQLGFSLR